MKLTDGIKRIEFRIDSYEFPYDQHSIYEDNNWLNVYVEWEDDVLMENGVSPCLLTSELKQLCDGCSKALIGQPYQSSFLEPNLNMAITPKEDLFYVKLSFAMPGRNRFEVACTVTKAIIDEFVSDLHAQCILFPERKNTMLN